jgi:aldose 1-epimerase
MELGGPDAQFPSGKLLPVEGTPYDLRVWRSLAGLFMDDVFYPKPSGAEAGVAFREEGLQLRITAADRLRHLICYSPEGRPFVCVENLTCCPDAQNLHARGFEEVSGLAIVETGGKLEGWVRYEVALL